ncbi:hypothetical protein [Streptomyces sp. uw30]|uniref:hypothetical protein n=1 Tax=Streptomyces sp. uw30 TaxID=1828179 RepID=UPI0039673CD0
MSWKLVPVPHPGHHRHTHRENHSSRDYAEALRRDGLDQRDQLGDVVVVAASGDCRERDAVRFDDQVVLSVGLWALRAKF